MCIGRLIVFAVLLALPSNASAMAVRQFFSDIIDGFSQGAQEPPKDMVDPSSGGCKSCNRGTVVDPPLETLVDAAYRAGNKNSPFQCVDLEIGESRIVDADAHLSPTPVEHKYKLSRTSLTEYEATFNLNFTLAGRGTDPREEMRMRNRVKNCLAVANKALRGPSGETLRLRVQQPGERPAAPEVGIRIENPGLVNHSRGYAADIACPAIIHELLHLMGLVDEYDHSHAYGNDPAPASGYLLDEKKEEATLSRREQAGYDYSCRALGPEDSIMRSSDKAFWKAFGLEQKAAATICSCEMAANTSACHEGLSRALRDGLDQCPPNTSAYDPQVVDLEKIDLSQPQPMRTGPDSVQVVSYSGPLSPDVSLLKPAHFRAITNPGCAVNNEYYICSSDAYKGRGGGTGRENCAIRTPPSACSGKGNHSWIEAR
ncbi:MAG: hypothetical protein HUU37_01450 [Bdellovibrionales bacterium]|nr:hypothetical protein [Bdellovibrionales bacterium]